jgi:lysophospholipase L1-like esterase
MLKLLLAILLFVGSNAVFSGEPERFDFEAAAKRSLVSAGDPVRLQRVLAKAARGEAVTVGVIGGSITQGAAATRFDRNYGSLIAKWWRETFSNVKIELVNAGIGATGSNYGALRAQRDLLDKKPDFVVVEYAVNDGNGKEFAETLEGLVRQILKQPQSPAVVLLFTMHNNGANAQEWHGKIGEHYALPMVSFRDALWPEIEAKRLKWEDVEADIVHPNDRGHDYAAQFVTRMLAEVQKMLPPEKELPAIKPLPAPLISDQFENVALHEAFSLKPTKNEGWRQDLKNKCWKSDAPGSTIEFEIEGQRILFMEWKVRGDMGRAKIQVDELPPIVHDAWFEQTWGGYRLTTEVARDLKPGKHTVRVELLKTKNAQSNGYEFRILGIGAAGITP